MSKVAVVELGKDREESFRHALNLVGGMEDLNVERPVTVKVGIFSHKAKNHSTPDIVRAIVNSFTKAPRIYLAESDNYRGKGSERLRLYAELFSERVIPFNLSEDTDMRRVTLAGQDMDLSHILFKPHILVDTHILRAATVGSILKNLFGCTSDRKRAKYHKETIFFPLLADIYNAVGGIDLAVLDGTNFFYGEGDEYVPVNILLVGRDAVAVESVGAYLAGLDPGKMQIIQEFARRGFGEGNLDNIEVVGASLESMREKCASAVENAKEK